MVAALAAAKKPFRRGTKALDTLTLPKPIAERLVTRVGGEPIAIRSGNALAVMQVKEAKDAPVPAADRLKIAQAALARSNADAATAAQVKQLRDAADISYLPGFAPPPAPKNAP